MKIKSLLFLLLLVGGLGTYIYYGIQKPAEEKAANGTGDKIAKGDFAKIEFIEIDIKTGKIRLEKEGNYWRLTSPIKDLASETKVTNLISALQKLRSTKVIASADKLKAGKDIGQYGLKEPKAKIQYKTSDEPKISSVTVGSQNPSFSGSYIQKDDSPEVLLATMDLDYLATQRLDDFREMRLTTVPHEKFSAIEIRRNGTSMTFKKDADQWKMTAPYELPVDHEALKGLIEKVSLVRANSFLDKSPTTKAADIQVIVGFDEGVTDARTSPQDSRPQGLQIDFYRAANPSFKAKPSKGAKTPTEDEKFVYYAKGDKTPFAAVSKFHFENFEKAPEAFVKKSFDDFLISDVQKFSIRRPSAPAVNVVRKDDSTFEVQKDKDAKTANVENVEDILRQLRNMRALQFVDKRKPATDKSASLKIDIDLRGGDKRSYVFELKKDIGELYQLKDSQWLRFVTSAEPVKVSSFDFDFLTKTEKPKD